MQLMPDGTSFKGAGLDGKARQGDLKAVIGVTQVGDIVPLGSWAGFSWQEVHRQWKRQGVSFAPGSIVVCDGELGLAEGFAQYAGEQQRCQWHVGRDLYHAMHQDGAGMKEVRPVQRRLAGAMAVELQAGEFEKVSEPTRRRSRQGPTRRRRKSWPWWPTLNNGAMERRLPISGTQRRECSAT